MGSLLEHSNTPRCLIPQKTVTPGLYVCRYLLTPMPRHPDNKALNQKAGSRFMKLSPQQFSRVFDFLRAEAAARGSDKRQMTRMEVQATVTLAMLKQGKPDRQFTALTRDVSINGLGLFQHSLASIGETFVVRFPLEKEEMFMVCAVRFCRPVAQGLYGVGSEFIALADAGLADELRKSNAAVLDRISHAILG
jgi:PilZ domain